MNRIGSENMNKIPGGKSGSKASNKASNTTKRKYFNPYTTNTTTKQSEINNSTSRSSKMNKSTVNKSTGGTSYKRRETSSRQKIVEKKTNPYGNKTGGTKRKVGTTIQSSAKTKQAIKRQRKRKKRIRQILAIAQLLLVILGTTFAIWAFFNLGDHAEKPKISEQTAKIGTIDDSSELEGVILRNEETIYGELSNDIRYVVTEGEKVKKDGMVYVVVDETNLETSKEEQSEIDNQIYDKAEQREDISYYQDDIHNINKELTDDFNVFYNNRYQETTNFAYTLRGQLEKSIENRMNVYTKEQEDRDEPIIAKKEEIENNIDKYQIGKTASKSGIISYQIDGKETKDALSVLNEINYTKYKELSSKSKVNSEDGKTPIYKIILDNKWYIVSYIDKSREEEFKQGETYTLYFEHNTKEVPFKLKSMTTESGQKMKLVFETSNQISEFLDTRNVKFSIGNRNVSGIKIPKDAIVEQNMIKIPTSYTTKENSNYGVYRQRGEVSEYVEIEVEYKEEDYLYVRQDIGNLNNLQVNDILVEPTNSSDKKEYKLNEIITVKGVYVINGGIAEFKTTSIVLLSSEYAIVDEEGKTELRVGDKIISNPKSIEIDQLIKDMDVQNE